MSQIIFFTPKHKLSAQQNLDKLIEHARNRLTLWSDLENFNWNSDIWPTNQQAVRFIKFEYSNLHHSTPLEARHLMLPKFAEFAKAYLRYSYTISPNQRIGRTLLALRVIESALNQDMIDPDITKLSQRHWDKATSVIEHYVSRQDICNSMLAILKLMSDLLILPMDASFWRNPYRGKQSYDSLNGTRAPADVKAGKLPHQDALLAIAEVFSRHGSETQEDSDVMVTCITGLMMSAPMRISEALRFRTDCLRDEVDKNGKRQHFLAYWVPKTRQFTRKAVPATMVEVAIAAIERLTLITEDGRKLARYMETNPTKFYRHADCPDVPDDQILTPDQVLKALGYKQRHSPVELLKKHTGSPRITGFTLDTLWQLILSEHRSTNPHFPYQVAPRNSKHSPLKMSESLLCFRRLQLTDRLKSPVLLAPFYGDLYSQRFNQNEKFRGMNFFSRHGYNPIPFNSHSLRHLLNRLARSSGVSVDMLTEWSSRATIRQTRTYLDDDPIKAATLGAVVFGTTQEQEPLNPVSNEEAEIYGNGPYHRSRYGICRRSWRTGPCNKFADCLNCSELLMCKGDKIATDIIKSDRDNLLKTYTAAQQAIAKGERSASRWTEKARPQIERLDQLLVILHDPEIPDGSPIEMTSEDFSHEKVIVSEKAETAGVKLLDRNELRITYGDDLLICLELLRSSDNA